MGVRGMGLSLVQLLCLLLLLACAASADGAGRHRSCSISADWNLTVTYRSVEELDAVLPAPYCLLISPRMLAGPMWVFYAVDFVSGSLAWQWQCTQPPAGSGSDGRRSSRGYCGPDMSVGSKGGVVPSLSATGRVYVSAWQQGSTPSGHCDVMSALDAASGQTLYNDSFCSPQLLFGIAVVMPFQLSALPASQELVIHAAVLQGDAGLQVILRVLNGSTGVPLSASSVNVSGIWTPYPQPLNNGRDGLFTMWDALSHSMDVYELRPDGSVRLAASNVSALSGAVPSHQPSLASQPALNLDSLLSPQLVIATDLLTNTTRWSSSDAFMVGASWGSNGSFSHVSTAFVQLTAFPDLFVVLNTAAGPNASLVAAAALYTLSAGKQLALTPTYAFRNLSGLGVTLWELEGERALVLRADDLWYVLDLPSLAVRTAGRYATWDAALRGNNWLVSVDGSYIAMPYSSEENNVQGYSPRQTYVAPAFSSSSSSSPPSSSSSSSSSMSVAPLPAATSYSFCSSPPPAPDPASSLSSAFTPLVIGLLCVIAALLAALLLVIAIAFRRRLVSASGAGGDGGSADVKREKLLSSHGGFHS